MKTKIFILAVVACCYQVTVAQRPTVFPMPALGTAPPFLSAFNTNWVRPYYSAAAEGWRTYFEQLQQARNQLYQTLSNLQNTAQNTSRNAIAQILSTIPLQTKQAHDDDESHEILGDLQPPTAEAPAHDAPQEIQIVQTITRPQVQNDAPKARPPQVTTVTHTVSQAQPSARQPQTVTSVTRPVAPQVSSGVVSQIPTGTVSQVPSGVVSQVGSQMVPQVPSGVVSQVGSQMVPQVGGQIVPQVGSQLPSWVGK